MGSFRINHDERDNLEDNLVISLFTDYILALNFAFFWGGEGNGEINTIVGNAGLPQNVWNYSQLRNLGSLQR